MARVGSEPWRHRFGPWGLVTGASEGIGRAIAVQLAEAGLDVVLVARRSAELKELASELSAVNGVRAQVIVADLSTAVGVAAVLEGTLDLDIGTFVAAAGFGTSGVFIDQPLAPELEMLDLNCRAVVALTHGFAQRLAARGRGGVVLLSSLVAFSGVPFAAHYAATKAFVQTLAEGLHLELAPRGVHVLAVAPGPVHSGFAARAGMKMGLAQRPAEVARGALAALGRRATVRPGLLAKLLEASLAPLPRGLRARIMERIMGSMTRQRVRSE